VLVSYNEPQHVSNKGFLTVLRGAILTLDNASVPDETTRKSPVILSSRVRRRMTESRDARSIPVPSDSRKAANG
jgi:hypothetical protein